MVGAAASPIPFASPSSSALFSPKQWKAIADIFGSTKVSDDKLSGEFSSSYWIIDSGATHHVMGEISFMFNVVSIPSCLVGLPNGSKAVATKKGSVRLCPSITLTNVLLVPKFSCSLLSVAQLTNDLQRFVQFNSSMFAIQDHMR